MNSTLKIVLIGNLLILAIAIFGCGSDSSTGPVNNNNNQQGSSENSFVVNGGGYNNLQVTLSNAVSLGVYSIPDSLTAISVSATDTSIIQLVFPGKTTGQLTGLGGVVSFAGSEYFTDSVSVNVTTYEAPGGKIKGTFEGSFFNKTGSINISSGKFSAVRQPDSDK